MEEEEHPAELLAQMPPDRIAELVGELADDDAADLIGELEPADRERVLDSVAESEEIRELLEYPEDSAGGIMTPEVVAVAPEPVIVMPLPSTAGATLPSPGAAPSVTRNDVNGLPEQPVPMQYSFPVCVESEN